MNKLRRGVARIVLVFVVLSLAPTWAHADGPSSKRRVDTPEEKASRQKRVKAKYQLDFDSAPAAAPATGPEEHAPVGAGFGLRFKRSYPSLKPTQTRAVRKKAVFNRRKTKTSVRAGQGTAGRASPRVATDNRSILGQPGQSIYFGQVYGSKNGAAIGCNVDIASDVPDPTRGITYGIALSCNNPAIHGTGISHLGEASPTPLRGLQAGSFFGVSGGYDLPINYRSPPQYYSRESETQTEQIYAYFDLTIDGVDGVDGWLTPPAQGGAVSQIKCNSILKRTLTCELVSDPFPFVPNGSTRCASGDACVAANSVKGQVDALPGQVAGIAASAQQAAANAAAYFVNLTKAGSTPVGSPSNCGLPGAGTDLSNSDFETGDGELPEDTTSQQVYRQQQAAEDSSPVEETPGSPGPGTACSAVEDNLPAPATRSHRSAFCELSNRVFAPELTSFGFLTGLSSPTCSYAGPAARAVLTVCIERLDIQRFDKRGWNVVGSCSPKSFTGSRLFNMNVAVAKRCKGRRLTRTYRTLAVLTVNGQSAIRKSPQVTYPCSI